MVLTDDDLVRAVCELTVIEFWTLGDEARVAATRGEGAVRRVQSDDTRAQLDAHRASFEAMANRPIEALDRVAAYSLDQPTGRARSTR